MNYLFAKLLTNLTQSTQLGDGFGQLASGT
jgi:hypothetical protein